MKQALKSLAPLIAVVSAVFAASPAPAPFGLSTSVLGLTAFVAVAVAAFFAFSEKDDAKP